MPSNPRPSSCSLGARSSRVRIRRISFGSVLLSRRQQGLHDLSFYDELQARFGAAGDFAQAYVIAHEIGHHVQNVLGIDNQMRRAQQQRPGLANQLSVRSNCRRDCLAGVWGHSTAQRDLLEKGDIEEGLNAPAAIGDDQIQRMSGRGIRPDRFTHGSSAQRVEWFRRGLESGRMAACDTFGQ